VLHLLLALVASCQPQAAAFELASPKAAATILVPPAEPECVRLAAADLASDVERITGHRPPVVDTLDACHRHCVVLATATCRESRRLLERFSPRIAEGMEAKWEAFRVRTVAASVGPVRHALLVAGSDERGTMFGTYAFCEQFLGVDPMHFWADRPPAKRARLAWDNAALDGAEPTFRYRGWFLNDEDLLTEWFPDGGARDIAYRYYHQVTSPQATRHVFEALLRLRCNLVIPASFIDIRNPAEERLVRDATRRGLFVSQHHIEPLGVSGYGFANYWRDKGEKVPFSFVRHRDKFEHTWRHYAERWAKYAPRVVWQLGLRGIADRPVWASDPAAPKSDQARGRLISNAMALQWRIVREVDPRPHPPATTTLWMEGADLHAKGHLRFPPGVAAIFADNSPGWKLQRDFYHVEREPGRPYGVYYHQQLWGSGPHLVQAVSPHRMHAIFSQAVERQTTHYVLFNVGNVREFLLGVDAGARLVRDFRGFHPDRYLATWCRERFGAAAPQAVQAYRRFFDSYVADARRNTRRLLDGEILSRGRRFLTVLHGRLKTRRKPMLDHPERVRALLERVRAQRQVVDTSGEDVAAIVARLDGAGRRLFETNFVAQHRVLLGLLAWLEHGLVAGLALHEQNVAKALTNLRLAERAFERIRSGQTLTSRGQKWEHWYRGDRKMDLASAETLTRQLSRLVAAKAAK